MLYYQENKTVERINNAHVRAYSDSDDDEE